MDALKQYEFEKDIYLICGDCLEIMPKIEDKSIDLVLTDPPYGINFVSSRTKRKEKIKGDKFEEWLNLMKQWLLIIKPIMSDRCCCCCCGGGGKTPVTAILTMEIIKHFNLIQTLVWKKFIGLGWRYRPAYENILIFSKNDKNYNFFDESKKCSNIIEGINQDIPQYRNNEVGYHDEHPTQKPEALMKKLLFIHSQKGYLVLDPFMGSGTTGVACKELGRKFIGIEINKDYYEIAKKRIANTQRSMF